MITNDDAAYFQSRAEQEDEAVRNAATELAADIHRDLAKRYRAKASNAYGR